MAPHKHVSAGRGAKRFRSSHFQVLERLVLPEAYAYGMESVGAHEGLAKAVEQRSLAVSIIDTSSDIRRKSHNDAGVRPLSNGLLEILRVIESHPGITVAEVAFPSRPAVQQRQRPGGYSNLLAEYV